MRRELFAEVKLFRKKTNRKGEKKCLVAVKTVEKTHFCKVSPFIRREKRSLRGELERKRESTFFVREEVSMPEDNKRKVVSTVTLFSHISSSFSLSFQLCGTQNPGRRLSPQRVPRGEGKEAIKEQLPYFSGIVFAVFRPLK